METGSNSPAEFVVFRLMIRELVGVPHFLIVSLSFDPAPVGGPAGKNFVTSFLRAFVSCG